MRMLIIYLILAVFTILALTSCTNDEGGEDLDVITPADEQKKAEYVEQPE